jgi:hypothetical protein
MPLGDAKIDPPSLVTAELSIGGCASEADLRQVGGALRCIRGVVRAEAAADGRHIAVAYKSDKVVPLQLERAVRAMGASLDGIVVGTGAPAPCGGMPHF